MTSYVHSLYICVCATVWNPINKRERGHATFPNQETDLLWYMPLYFVCSCFFLLFHVVWGILMQSSSIYLIVRLKTLASVSILHKFCLIGVKEKICQEREQFVPIGMSTFIWNICLRARYIFYRLAIPALFTK